MGSSRGSGFFKPLAKMPTSFHSLFRSRAPEDFTPCQTDVGKSRKPETRRTKSGIHQPPSSLTPRRPSTKSIDHSLKERPTEPKSKRLSRSLDCFGWKEKGLRSRKSKKSEGGPVSTWKAEGGLPGYSDSLSNAYSEKPSNLHESQYCNLKDALPRISESLVGTPNEISKAKEAVLRWACSNANITEQVGSLEGKDAHDFQDILDKIATGAIPDSEESNVIQSCIRKIARSSGQLPSSLFIDGIERTEDIPYTGGGFADIYIGKWQGQQVAMKAIRIFAPKNQHDKIFKECYQEALAWKSLSHHPCILPFLGIAADAFERRICFISPWMKHGNIMQYLRMEKPSNPLHLLSQTAEAVLYIHQMHFNHGDIKSANILVDENGNARLADLGQTTISTTHAFNSSHVGSACGTTRWMAPELFTNSCHFTYATDVYAFGMTMYEVMSGKVPFHRSREFAVIGLVIKGQRPPRPSDSASSYPVYNGVWRLIERCWNQDAQARCSMSEVVSELQDLSASAKLAETYPYNLLCIYV